MLAFDDFSTIHDGYDTYCDFFGDVDPDNMLGFLYYDGADKDCPQYATTCDDFDALLYRMGGVWLLWVGTFDGMEADYQGGCTPQSAIDAYNRSDGKGTDF